MSGPAAKRVGTETSFRVKKKPRSKGTGLNRLMFFKNALSGYELETDRNRISEKILKNFEQTCCAHAATDTHCGDNIFRTAALTFDQ